MLKQIIILFLTVLLASCTHKKSSEPLTETLLIHQVNLFMNSWHQAASDSHFEAYFDKIESKGIFIGTDASENWPKQEFETYSKPHFAKGAAWNFKMLERNIYMDESKEVIWFDELLDTWMGICRGSGVIIVENSKFKIKHYVLSLAIPNDDIQKVIDATSENNAIALKNIKLAL
jgi:hypothetical protein